MGLGTPGHVLSERSASMRSRTRARRRVNGPMLWLVLPVVLWMLFSFGIPQLYMLYISFMKQGAYGGVVYHFTLSNYVNLKDPLYLHIVWISLLFALVITLLTLAVGYPFAYAIATSPPKRRVMFLFMVIIPFWTSELIRAFAIMFMTSTTGLINEILMHLHLISQPLNILYTPLAVYIGQFYTMLPYMVLPLFASIQSHLERGELLEAASDLGAGPIQTFFKVTFPLTTSGIAVGVILVFIPTLATYFMPLLMSGGTYTLIGNYIGDQFLTNDNWPFGASTSVGVIVITLIIISVMFRFMKNAFMEES